MLASIHSTPIRYINYIIYIVCADKIYLYTAVPGLMKKRQYLETSGERGHALNKLWCSRKGEVVNGGRYWGGGGERRAVCTVFIY